MRIHDLLHAIEIPFGSWDKPRHGHEIAGVFDAATSFLETVHAQVRAETQEVPCEKDLPALTRRVIAGLGLPDAAANPLTAQAIASHCRHLDLDLQTL